MLQITSEQAKGIAFDDSDEFSVVEKGEWISEGKYQSKTIIFKDSDSFYRLNITRSGSYHTEWYYDFEYEKTFQCDEVELKEIIIKTWAEKENVNG